MAITRGFVGAVSGLVGVPSQCLPGLLSSAITTFVVVAVGTLSTAQAQNRAALCEREADAEQPVDAAGERHLDEQADE